jgi:hypothetical protein
MVTVTFVTWFTMLVLIAPAPPYSVSVITVEQPYLSKEVCEANTPAFIQVVEALEKDGIKVLDGEACVRVEEAAR